MTNSLTNYPPSTLNIFISPPPQTPITKILCQSCQLYTHTKPEHKWISRCQKCNALQLFFTPTPLQQQFLNDPYKTTILMTSYGSGKTTTSAYYWSLHLRKFPSSLILACAQTVEQLTNIIQTELDKFFLPEEFISKSKDRWTLKNHSQIVFVSDKNDQAIRSANASGIWLVEASQINQNYYKEGLARLRNKAAFITDPTTNQTTDHTKIIIETNPTFGWVKDLAFQSDQITLTPKVKNKDLLAQKAKNHHKSISTYLATIEDNPYLPKQFIITNQQNRTQAESDLMLYCDLTQAHDLVFENIVKNKTKYSTPFSPYAQPHSQFVESIDIGGANPQNHATAYILGRFNTITKTLEILSAWKHTGTVIAQDTQRIQHTREQFSFNKAQSLFFTGDNMLNRSDKKDRHSLKSEYETRLATHLDVSKVKVGGIKQGNELIKTWFLQNKVIINTQHTTDLWDEFNDYKHITIFKFDKHAQTNITTSKFIGNDDLIDALKYLIVKLNQYYPYDQNNINTTNQIYTPTNIPSSPSQTNPITQTFWKQMETKFTPTPTHKNLYPKDKF